MSFNFSPKIVQDGLILYVDAANPKSYPGTGTLWGDLTKHNDSGTLINGPTFDGGNGGSIVFDGVDDYVSLTSGGTSQELRGISGFTASVWVKKPSSGVDFLIGAQDANTTTGWFMQWYLDDNIYVGVRNVPYGGYNYVNLPWTSDWYNITMVFNGQETLDIDRLKIYVDTNIQSLTTSTYVLTSVPTDPVDFLLGSLVNYGTYSTCNLSNVIIYNRILSQSEITQNYNTLRSRFGK